MRLQHQNLDFIHQHYHLPFVQPSRLQEQVIQFGTGSLLRALPDFYIDYANRRGHFKGSIVVIKSTQQGDISDFVLQNNLYTLHIQGIYKGALLQQQHIITCISRVILAQQHWDKVLALATNRHIKYIISNTTESGLLQVEDQDSTGVPHSYSGKLTALLYARYNAHHHHLDSSGFIILPTELVDHNGDRLKALVLQLAQRQQLPAAFISWVEKHNYFCNTLVDRIVPGKINHSPLPYEDTLAIAAEPYHLWAIETKNLPHPEALAFAHHNPGIKLVDSIEDIKELKLRLLNAIHTLTFPLAVLARHRFVRETMMEPAIEQWIRQLMDHEIKNHLRRQSISEADINDFATHVIDRFKNPFIDHKWTAIGQQSTAKWQQRILPMLMSRAALQGEAYEGIAFSMAAYLAYMLQDIAIDIPVDERLRSLLQQGKTVAEILSNTEIWSVNMALLPAFVEATQRHFTLLRSVPLTTATLLNLIPS